MAGTVGALSFEMTRFFQGSDRDYVFFFPSPDEAGP